MEAEKSYLVEITPEAESYYLDLLVHLYETHSQRSANRKSEEILLMAMSLSQQPYRGKEEKALSKTGFTHRFLVYPITKRNTVKIIYTISEDQSKVFVTDFFPCQMNQDKIKDRNK